MTTKEVETTTERIESERITFCDGCGADGRDTELVTLTKDARFESRSSPGGSPLREQFDQWHHSNSHRQYRATGDDQIDACEACLGEHFNENVVAPLFELEPRETGTQERETAESSTPHHRAAGQYAKLALLWVLFPIHMWCCRVGDDDRKLMGPDATVGAIIAVIVWILYVMAFLLAWKHMFIV